MPYPTVVPIFTRRIRRRSHQVCFPRGQSSGTRFHALRLASRRSPPVWPQSARAEHSLSPRAGRARIPPLVRAPLMPARHTKPRDSPCVRWSWHASHPPRRPLPAPDRRYRRAYRPPSGDRNDSYRSRAGLLSALSAHSASPVPWTPCCCPPNGRTTVSVPELPRDARRRSLSAPGSP